MLHDRLEHAIRLAERTQAPLSLLLIDLDRFKEINDTIGHQCGDVILKALGPRLGNAVRNSDTIARLGGDEFAVLLVNADQPEACLAAARIGAALKQPFDIGDLSFTIDASVGIALFPDHGTAAATLLQHADVAMYVAKRTRSSWVVYPADDDDYSPARLALVTELRGAIDQNQLALHYQPKISLRTGCADHVEALVRWQHPRLGLIPPAEFIPLAEHTGLIKPMTAWLLYHALDQCRTWRSEGLDISVAVNLSAQNIHDPGLFDLVAEALSATRVNPDWLELEITESVIMDDPFRAIQTLDRLRGTGIRISIDDFGTGYSSLAYLTRLPVDEIKIDRSFVADMDDNISDSQIVRATISLGHDLGLEVVAEGIETQEVYEQLRYFGCDMA